MTVLKRLVKLGGAAITDKQVFETINEEVLDACVEHLRTVIAEDGPGEATCIVHGAGSFGHHTAAAAGVAQGNLQREGVRAGFVATRASVLQLNLIIVRKLTSVGLPACSLSPAGSWVTCNRRVVADGTAAVSALLEAGFLPVLHGDAVLDTALGCTILSGDRIVQVLAAKLRPAAVIFLTNVNGVYTLPPDDPNAILVRSITVCRDGSWKADGDVPASSHQHGRQLCMTSSDLDTTGGIAAKVAESASIAAEGIDVFIVCAASEHALACLRFVHGEEMGKLDSLGDSVSAFGGQAWLGTHVKLSLL